ncbi:HAMP domain-containing sensor histidine kinase [soil metagenome]
MNIGATAPSFSQKHILVIDDEQRLAESLAALLRGVGYQVDSATSGEKGLALVAHQQYDLVITDLRMDGISGFDVMQHIAENFPHTALIVITGHASTESAIEALHQRVADYITKPFDFDFLKTAIERVFARQEAERLRRDLISMLTHDIKVPLTSVVGFAQLIVKPTGEVNPETPQCVDFIVLNCQRILSMLDNYLTNTRIEEGHLETLMLPIDLEDTVSDAMKMLSFNFRKKNIRIETRFSKMPERFTADEPLLFRAISNLLSNAAKYTTEGGQVIVSTSVEGDRAVLRVANSGSPLTEEETRKVFERYRRVGTAKGIEGSGLGLHVVRCIALAHGGEATCESRDDWTTFVLSLPIAPAD